MSIAEDIITNFNQSLQRSMDGLVRPEDPGQPLTIIEIQFQRAESIYNRIVVEMALVQEANDMCPVRGIIFRAPDFDGICHDTVW